MMTDIQDTSKNTVRPTDEMDDPDAVLAALEEEDDSNYRQQRMQEMHEESRSSQAAKSGSTATISYSTLKSDPEALQFSTEYERAVLHFFHPGFARCSQMDVHVQRIADKTVEGESLDVAFGRIDVNHAPFLVEKLAVRVLPCVLVFIKGVVKGRVTGFEGICWDGNESSPAVAKALEKNLVEWGILKRKVLDDDDSGDESDSEQGRKSKRMNDRRGIRDRTSNNGDDDDDWD